MLYLITLKDLSIHLLGLPYGPISFSKICLYVEVMRPFSHFSEDRTCSFLIYVMFICHLPTNSSGGVANAFLQSSDVEEVVWVSHMKSASVHLETFSQNVGRGMMMNEEDRLQ